MASTSVAEGGGGRPGEEAAGVVEEDQKGEGSSAGKEDEGSWGRWKEAAQVLWRWRG